jgi:hypothetical protein
MNTALCFTPDLAFFRPAVFTAASLISQGDSDSFDIFIVCEPDDVAPGFERLDPELRDKIHLLTVDFALYARGLARDVSPRRCSVGCFSTRFCPSPIRG